MRSSGGDLDEEAGEGEGRREMESGTREIQRSVYAVEVQHWGTVPREGVAPDSLEGHGYL